MEEIFSVSLLTQAIKGQLESKFPQVKVQGEVSNLKEQSSGHVYFTLKDADAQINAVLFRLQAQGLSRSLRNGDQLIVDAQLSVYPPRGSYQLIARSVQFVGLGELLLQLHALKKRLEQQGWFDPVRKKKLPLFPKTIGVVTSPTGAVIQDILHVLQRRLGGFHLILAPVKVQGDGAAEEIAQAIELFNQKKLADVLIVGRGGGSLEDLWAFNEERVASAIYHSAIPIVSAVGHETDFSIADFVADLRAPTPSAAAEIVSQEKSKQLLFLGQAQQRLTHTLQSRLAHSQEKLRTISQHPFLKYPLSLIEPYLQKLDDRSDQLSQWILAQLAEKNARLRALQTIVSSLKPENQIASYKQRLDALFLQLFQTVQQGLATRRTQFNQLRAHLQGINPDNLLQKGYCIPFQEKSASVILSVAQMKPGQRIRLKLHDGQSLLTVNETTT